MTMPWMPPIVGTDDEAVAHVDETGHQVKYNEDVGGIWACLDCPWTDSSFRPMNTG